MNAAFDASNDQRKRLMSNLQTLLNAYAPIHPSGPTSVVDALFAYRLFLGRMPALGGELEALFDAHDVPFRQFINGILDSAEFSRSGGFFPSGHTWMAELERFRFWFRTSDRDMGVKMGMGVYEPKAVEVMMAHIKPGDVCLDIGAQTGFFTMHMASLTGSTGRVHALEPMSDSFDILTKNIRENRFDGIVSASKMACSAENAIRSFAQHSGMMIATDEPEGVTMIPCVRADDVTKDRVAFVKLDVEGHEPAVLLGMPRILERDRPVILTEVNEYWLNQANSSGQSYLSRLARYGYELKDIDNNEVVNVDQVTFQPASVMNILATPL
ncbi:FkbM family methyltransferase [Dyella soli]|nr:FkbM family methyltransferase [Dyella soli]